MSHVLSQLTALPPLGIYAFVVLWLAAESAGLPLPDEAVLLTLGFLAHRGTVSLAPLILCAIVGSAIGATISYQIGYALGRPVVARIASRIGISEDRLIKAESWVRQRGGIGVFLTRVLPFARNIASYAAGIASIPPRVFYPAMLIGTAVWCTVLASLGDAFGAHYRSVLHLGSVGLLIAGAAIVAAVVAWVIWSRVLKRGSGRPV